jgi:hypothetical protein
MLALGRQRAVRRLPPPEAGEAFTAAPAGDPEAIRAGPDPTGLLN